MTYDNHRFPHETETSERTRYKPELIRLPFLKTKQTSLQPLRTNGKQTQLPEEVNHGKCHQFETLLRKQRFAILELTCFQVPMVNHKTHFPEKTHDHDTTANDKRNNPDGVLARCHTCSRSLKTPPKTLLQIDLLLFFVLNE